MVEQAYVSVNPEVRIRSKNNVDFFLTMKDNGDIVRNELEISISEERYRWILKTMVGNRPIKKRYRKYQLPDQLILEVSEVDNGVFSYAEVEFSSIEEARCFQRLPFMVEEVSENAEYRMRSYWAKTRL